MTTLAMFTTIIVALITAVIGPLLMTWFKNKLETIPKNHGKQWEIKWECSWRLYPICYSI